MKNSRIFHQKELIPRKSRTWMKKPVDFSLTMCQFLENPAPGWKTHGFFSSRCQFLENLTNWHQNLYRKSWIFLLEVPIPRKFNKLPPKPCALHQNLVRRLQKCVNYRPLASIPSKLHKLVAKHIENRSQAPKRIENHRNYAPLASIPHKLFKIIPKLNTRAPETSCPGTKISYPDLKTVNYITAAFSRPRFLLNVINLAAFFSGFNLRRWDAQRVNCPSAPALGIYI